MYCIYRFSNPYQILSLEFIPETFLKFRKFQLQYFNEIYSYGKKSVRCWYVFEHMFTPYKILVFL